MTIEDRETIKQLRNQNNELIKRCEYLEAEKARAWERVKELRKQISEMSIKFNGEIEKRNKEHMSTDDLLRQFLDNYDDIVTQRNYSRGTRVIREAIPHGATPPSSAYTISKGELATVLMNAMRYIADTVDDWEGQARLPRSNYFQDLLMWRDDFNAKRYVYIDHDVIKHTVTRIRKRLKKNKG